MKGTLGLIGDSVTISPGVIINGNFFIEDFVYMDSGATIKQDISVGKGSVIGMGSVLIRDVESGSTLVGNRAKTLEKNNKYE